MRAVAHVGPTRNYWRDPAGSLGGYFFQTARMGGAVSTCLRKAQMSTLNHHAWNEDSLKNHYQTMLLGDPDMRVLDDRPLIMVLRDAPLVINPGMLNYAVGVEDAAGLPVEGAVVTLTLNDVLNEVVLGTGYTDAMGHVDLELLWPGAIGDIPEGSSVRVRAWHDMRAVVDTVLDTPISEACPGDLTLDGVVDVTDLLFVIEHWGTPYTIDDLLMVLEDWGCGASGV